jgi:hypothetical protein
VRHAHQHPRHAHTAAKRSEVRSVTQFASACGSPATVSELSSSYRWSGKDIVGVYCDHIFQVFARGVTLRFPHFRWQDLSEPVDPEVGHE